jgi:nucleobase:cation symporter-1, NCS1 family
MQNEKNTTLYSEDLAPIPQSNRTWNTWNYAALWISMSLCIPTYMLASSLINGGMSWGQAIFTIFLGNAIVLIPMILNGHAGAKYGIPFPVLARASFGVKGANIPAMLRAIVACGWFGIQTWIGGSALFQMLKVWFPAFDTLPQIFPSSWGLATGPAITFLLFWFLNMYIVYLGVESIRKLLVFKAIFLPVAALALLFWAISAAHGLGVILDQPSKFQTTGAFLGNVIAQYSRFYTLCGQSKGASGWASDWFAAFDDTFCVYRSRCHLCHDHCLWFYHLGSVGFSGKI